MPYRPLTVEITEDMKIIYELDAEELRAAVSQWLGTEHDKTVPDDWELTVFQYSGRTNLFSPVLLDKIKVTVKHST